MYKMLALDLDGTLLLDNKTISKAVKDEVKRLQDNDIAVILATGRNLANTISVVDELNLKKPLVCSDGAIIYDPIKKEIIHQLVVPDALVQKYVKNASKHLKYIEISTASKYVRYIADGAHKKFSLRPHKKNHDDGFISPHSFLRNVEVRDKPYFSLKDDGAVHMIILGSVENTELESSINIVTDKNISIRKNIWEDFYFINHKDVDKWNGLKYLANLLNIKNSEIIAIGDEGNDREMIEHAGIGVAMANANDDIKKIADEVTLSNEEDGVAFISKKYFLT